MECLPWMVPKSCEKPAMPKLSNLESFEMQHILNADEIRTRGDSSWARTISRCGQKWCGLSQLDEFSPTLYIYDGFTVYAWIQKGVPCHFHFVCRIDEDGSQLADCSIAECRSQRLPLSMPMLARRTQAVGWWVFTSCGYRLQPTGYPFRSVIEFSLHSARLDKCMYYAIEFVPPQLTVNVSKWCFGIYMLYRLGIANYHLRLSCG
jgi:hypothetical protein